MRSAPAPGPWSNCAHFLGERNERWTNDRRLTNEFSGRGYLSDGDTRLGNVTYKGTEHEDAIITARGHQIRGGPKQTDIVLSDFYLDPRQFGRILTLHLEDGRTFRGVITGDRFVISH